MYAGGDVALLISDYEIVSMDKFVKRKLATLVRTWRDGVFRDVIHAVITGLFRRATIELRGQQWDCAIISLPFA